MLEEDRSIVRKSVQKKTCVKTPQFSTTDTEESQRVFCLKDKTQLVDLFCKNRHMLH